MPRPFLARKPPAGRAAKASDAVSSTEKPAPTPTPVPAVIASSSAAKAAPAKKGKVAQMAANAISRVTRTRKAVEPTVEATPEPLTETEEQDLTIKTHGDEHEESASASERITRGRQLSEEPKRQTRKKASVLVVGMEVPEKPTVKRSTRSTRAAAPLDEIASPQTAPVGSTAPPQNTGTKASGSTKQLPLASRVTRKQQELQEKENATKEEEEKQEDPIPSSPITALPVDASLGVVEDLDDFSSTSSVYGDENFLPPPLAQSTPKPESSIPHTPQKSRPHIGFRDDEGYTPPKPRTLSISGPSLLSPRRHSPTRRRLWESSSAASTPRPSSPALQEVPKTAADLPESPIDFSIYEDPNRASASPMRRDQSNLMDVDARGDGAGSNVLRTPKKSRPVVTKKRTSSGGQKTPDGQIVEKEAESSDDDSDSESDSDLSSSEIEEPVPTKTRSKRQKKDEPLSTKELLGLAPRRKRATGRGARQRTPVIVSDDLGEDVPSDLEEELTAGAKKKSNGKKAAKAAKGKAVDVAAKKSSKSKAREETPTPSKPVNSKSRRTYGRVMQTDGDESDSSTTPVPGDRQRETLPPPLPSNSGAGKTGFTRDVHVQMKELKKKFAEVDEWDLQFEDVTPSSSLNSEL